MRANGVLEATAGLRAFSMLDAIGPPRLSRALGSSAFMRRLAIVLMAAAAAQSLCHAEITKLRPEDRKVIQDASRFHEVRATTNLPPSVVSLCADGRGKIAEPGQKWRVTDVITDDTLPRKRLIWAATDSDYYVVHYESGGIGHGYHVLVARFLQGNTKAELVWHAVGKPLKDYRALLDAIEHNSLHDELEYAH